MRRVESAEAGRSARSKLGARGPKVHATWYRGEHCNFNPAVAAMQTTDAIERFILHGWVPDAPFITPESRVTVIGSCLAQHIVEYLNARSYAVATRSESRAYVVKIVQGLVNTYALRQQFDWAVHGITPTSELWHGSEAEAYGYGEEVRRETLELFSATDVFILVFGLSEIWYDEPTGEVFWRAVPAGQYDPDRHKFRVSTVAENGANIRAIYDIIRELRPSAKIVFALSPMPLLATFRPASCITANSVSKAVLRTAVDEVYREVAHEGHLFYWPLYEIVQESFGSGRYAPDRRHVKDPILDYVMLLFERHFCRGSEPRMTLNEALVRARVAAGELPPKTVQFARAEDARQLRKFVQRCISSRTPERALLTAAYALECHPDSSEHLALLASIERARGGDGRKPARLAESLAALAGD